MSYWDYENQKVTHLKDQPFEGREDWVLRDCDCCGGYNWTAGYDAVMCDYCDGTGYYSFHKPSGLHAVYPGGSILGRSKPEPA